MSARGYSHIPSDQDFADYLEGVHGPPSQAAVEVIQGWLEDAVRLADPDNRGGEGS